MTIGIFYDSLLGIGGAERVVVELAAELGAEIITSGYDEKSLALHPETTVHNLGNMLAKLSKPIGCLFEAPIRFFLSRNKYIYDVNIYIGFTSIYGVRKKGKNIWYCLTPNRILYDLRQYKLSQQNIVGKIGIWLHILLFFLWDKRCVNAFPLIVSQTQNIRNRVKKYYHKESVVIYPPVQNSSYKNTKVGDYFLAVSRLYPEKRMSLIAQAFTGLPHRQLILVGDGPERSIIEEIVKQNNNITLLRNISDEELAQLYANCRATIYIPIDEDYGLVPIESMSAGKPCIAANEGGCKETVVHGVTGLLVEPEITNIQAATALLTKEWVTEHIEACYEQAEKFDMHHCVSAWRKLLGAN